MDYIKSFEELTHFDIAILSIVTLFIAALSALSESCRNCPKEECEGELKDSDFDIQFQKTIYKCTDCNKKYFAL